MTLFEKIEGEKADALLEELIEDKTLVKVSIPGHRDYESLTVISEFRNHEDYPLFRITVPEGLSAALENKPSQLIGFEFTARDHLNHQFEAELHVQTQYEVWLGRPDHIKRFQMRKNFRIRAPRGAELSAVIEGQKIRMTIINISIGGAYCHCAKTQKAFIESCQKIENIELEFTLRKQRDTIPIRSAEVRRIEPNVRPNRFGVAYEFTNVAGQAKKQLTQQIYDLQREFLQNRLKLSP